MSTERKQPKAAANGQYHLDVLHARIHYGGMLVSVLLSWRPGNPGVPRRIPALVLLAGVALCLMLSGCLFSAAKPEPFFALDEEGKAPKKQIHYAVEFRSKPENGALISELRENSQLVWLQEDLPDSRVGLERRLLEDVETAKKILHSRGYYDGRVRHKIDWEASPPRVSIVFVPGERYTIGATALRYERPASAGSATNPEGSETVRGVDFMEKAPGTLEPFGLRKGLPAEAQTVLNAVAAVPKAMHKAGYPLAEQGKARYVIDRSTRTLDAEVIVKTGPLLRMGPVLVQEDGRPGGQSDAPGAPPVSESYLNMLSPWVEGQYWNDDLLKDYRSTLQETGLFTSIDMKPARLSPEQAEAAGWPPVSSEAGAVAAGQPLPGVPEGGISKTGSGGTPESPKTSIPARLWVSTDGTTPVSLTVRDAPPRTVSGGMHFSTDTGFGVRGAWENRNLFGGGEQLRITAPLSEKSQSLNASFRKPAFGIRDQSLVGEAWAVNETTDAYDQKALSAAGGLERRFRKDWRNWWASARVSLEAGSLRDNERGRRAYTLVGFPMSVRRDTTNDLLNPTSGTRLNLEVTPYTGTFNGPLTTVRTRVDASGYWSPGWERLVLAGRVAAGSLSGESVYNIPASLRFYTGGGGSVRGYKYQSLGPHDKEGDPVGGLSFTDVSLEARFRLTETFGIVPFVDGGMVYESSLPDWGRNLSWGVGLGFRYYTLIGPIRLDIATPLQDRDNNKAFQIYLSIGQAF